MKTTTTFIFNKFLCHDENDSSTNSLTSTSIMTNKVVSTKAVINLIDSPIPPPLHQQSLPLPAAETSITPQQLLFPPATATTTATATATTTIPSLPTNKITATETMKAVKAKAAPKPRQPSINKFEKDFDKLPLEKRQELLKKWNADTSLVVTDSSSLPATTTTATTATTVSSSSSSSSSLEECDLFRLRLQLGETTTKIMELQSREKRLKSSIRKLQRKVVMTKLANGSDGDTKSSAESLETILGRLFHVQAMERQPAGLVKQHVLTSQRAPLWWLAGQCDEFAADVATRLLKEERYESLEAAASFMENLEIQQQQEGEEEEDLSEELIFAGKARHEIPSITAAAPSPPVSYQPNNHRSVLSQILSQFNPCRSSSSNSSNTDSRVSQSVDIRAIEQLVRSSDVGRQLQRLLSVEMDHNKSSLKDRQLGLQLLDNLRIAFLREDAHLSNTICACIAVVWSTIECRYLKLEENDNSAQNNKDKECLLPFLVLDNDNVDEPFSCGEKRSSFSDDMAELFTQRSSKKPRFLDQEEEEEEEVKELFNEPISLLDSPEKAVISSVQEVVDLSNDGFDFYDIPWEPEVSVCEEQSSSTLFSLIGTTSSTPGISLLERMKILDSEVDCSCSQPIVHIRAVIPDSTVENTTNEPNWSEMDDKELLTMATQYGLKPEPRSKLLRLVRSMWKRMDRRVELSQSTTSETKLTVNELRSHLLSNPALSENIFSFEPVELDDVHAYLRTRGQKVSKTQLLKMLDALSIFVSSSNGKRDR